MGGSYFLQTGFFLVTLLLGACVHPISEEAREQVDNRTTFAMVSENPTAFLDQHLILLCISLFLFEHPIPGSLLFFHFIGFPCLLPEGDHPLDLLVADHHSLQAYRSWCFGR